MKALIIVGEDAGEPVYAIGQDAQGLPCCPKCGDLITLYQIWEQLWLGGWCDILIQRESAGTP